MNILWIKDNNAVHEKQAKILLDELSKISFAHKRISSLVMQSIEIFSNKVTVFI